MSRCLLDGHQWQEFPGFGEFKGKTFKVCLECGVNWSPEREAAETPPEVNWGKISAQEAGRNARLDNLPRECPPNFEAFAEDWYLHYDAENDRLEEKYG